MTSNAAPNGTLVRDGENSKHEPVKRALFVGIAYKNRKQATLSAGPHPVVNLRRPHYDCIMLSKFIQVFYEYKENDIVMLLDTIQNMRKRELSHLRPTKENILREMKNLVKGAKPGDSFFFHYSGHGDQVPCGPDDEEPDGLDETLVPYDAKPARGGGYEPETLILDNDMHKLMVKDLPVGARLTAVYDMSHAGTALDLNHYECNRALHPFWWKSLEMSFEKPGSGERTANEDKIASSPPVRVIPNRPVCRRSHSEPSTRIQPAIRPSSPSPCVPFIRSYSLPSDPIPEWTNSIAPDAMMDGVASSAPKPLSEPKKYKGVLSFLRNAKNSWPLKIFRRQAKAMEGSLSAGHDVIKGAMSPKAKVESPPSYAPPSENQSITSPKPMDCTCAVKGGMNDADLPDIISISACSDDQFAIEGPEGASVTNILIDILEKDPYPTYNQLMKEMSSRSLYNQAIEMLHFYKLRKDYREWLKDLRRKGNTFKGLDTSYLESVIESVKNEDEDEWEEFVVKKRPIQDPQLGSQKRLNLNDKFSP